MKETDKGDVNAFEKLMDEHAPNIERLAIQYGCTSEQAGKITEETFRTFQSRLNNLDGDARHLYKIAIEKLLSVQLTETAQKINFSFEEDQQLHEKIILLEKNEKIAFILSRFHGMKETEITNILGLPEETIKQGISEAYRYLNKQETKLERRLEFLSKTYSRLVLLFEKENVFHVPVEEKIETNIEQKLPKKVLLSWMAGIITLIALVAYSILTGEEFQQSAAVKYVERLDSSFESEVEKKFSELGLTEEIIFAGTPYSFPFATNAREEFEAMMSQVRGQLNRNQKLNKKEIKQQYDEVISKLELPAEMLDRLFKNPLTNDKEKSEAFITEYYEKFLNLKESFHFIFIGHERILEDAMIDGEIDIETFLEARDSFPENVKNALEGMIRQNYYPISIPNWAPFYPKHVNNEVSKQLRDSLHQDVAGFITFLESEPFLNYPDLVYSIDESIDFMNEMEKTLLKIDTHSTGYMYLIDTYLTILGTLTLGSETNEIFDHAGMVKEEYRRGWEKIASFDKKFPSAFIMKQIVDEMEASDWKVSEAYNNLEHGTFDYALSQAKRGSLSSDLLKEEVMQYGRVTISPNDPEYKTTVKESYEKFSRDFESHHLQHADPLIILGIYYLANELEDPYTMWHLFDRGYYTEPLEDYVKDWKKVEPLPADMETLTVELGGSSLNGNPHVPVGYEIGNTTYYFAWFLNDGDPDHVWKIQDISNDINH